MADRVFLGACSLVWLPYGIFCLVQPSFLDGAAGVAATSATGTAELRAMYGGLQAAIGVLCLCGCLSPAWRPSALTALVFLAAGLGLGRLVAVAAGAGVSSYTAVALVFEFATAGLALALLRRRPAAAAA